MASAHQANQLTSQPVNQSPPAVMGHGEKKGDAQVEGDLGIASK